MSTRPPTDCDNDDTGVSIHGYGLDLYDPSGANVGHFYNPPSRHGYVAYIPTVTGTYKISVWPPKGARLTAYWLDLSCANASSVYLYQGEERDPRASPNPWPEAWRRW